MLEPGGIRTDWAASSMTIPPISKPYERTVGRSAELLRGFTGKQPSDARKIAGLILRRAGREDAPLRLLIGPDAVEYAGKATEALAESDKKWLDVSLSTAYEQHPTSERSTG